MGPAGTAVCWEMLVPDVGKVVSSVNVVPSDLLWEVLNVNEWLGDEWFSSVGVADSAWVVDGLHLLLLFRPLQLWLQYLSVVF